MEIYKKYVMQIFEELNFLNIFTATDISFNSPIFLDHVKGYPIRSLGIDFGDAEIELSGEFQFPQIINNKLHPKNALLIKYNKAESKILNKDLSSLFKLYADICEFVFGELEYFEVGGEFTDIIFA
jgi:hypothetical protein